MDWLVTLSGTGREARALVGGVAVGLETLCKMGVDLAGKLRAKVTGFPSLGTGTVSPTTHNRNFCGIFDFSICPCLIPH